MVLNLSGRLHEGLDDLFVHAFKLRPINPLRLRMGPLFGDPGLPAGGVPEVDGVSVPLTRRRTRLVIPTPVPDVQAPNDQMHLYVYPPRGRSLGSVVFSPFWQIPGPWALMPYVDLVRSLGLTAVVYTPPEHMHRTPRGYFSGERILGWDFPHMERMLQLAAAELVSVTKGLAEHGRPVFLVGLSLGGLYAAMAALGGAPLSGLALITPAADVQVSMDRTRIGRRYRHLVERRGDVMPTGAELEQLGIPYRARSFERPLPADRVFLAHGYHDGVVPLGVATDLAASWEVPLRAYPCGHMSLLFLQRAVRADLKHFLQSCLARDLGERALQPRRGTRRRRLARALRSVPNPLQALGTLTRLSTLSMADGLRPLRASR